MKKISIWFVAICTLCLAACKNKEAVFPDFGYTTVYFPIQYPIRTLVLGDYSSDNTNDNNLRFLITAHMGGVYENKKDRTMNYVLDPSLANKLSNGTDDLEILPAKYYTLNPISNITIPSGSFTGDVTVQLTQAFLDDPLAYKIHYVVPLRITASTSGDSVLAGKASIANPDPRIAGNWTTTPKNFTLFGIKFVNAYHGKYLHRGKSVIVNGAGATVETIVYHQKFVEQDEVWSLQTNGRSKVFVSGILRSSAGSPGNYIMDLNFNADNTCVISKSAGSPFDVTGTGKFVKNGDTWGNEPRDAIYLNYKVTQGTNVHNITDTLVIRDRDVRYEEFAPTIKP